MTAKLRGNPMFQALTDAGAPLSGGKVHTYEPGTTDAKATYTDATGTTEHPNPITLDSRGEAKIYWGTGLYDVVLKDSDGNTVNTLSNYDPQVEDVPSPSVNLIENGSFELDSDGNGVPDNWATASTDGNTISIDDTDQSHGGQSLKFVGVDPASGGTNFAISDFFAINEDEDLDVLFNLKSSLAGVSNQVVLNCYDGDQAYLGVVNIYTDYATNPTAWTRKRFRVTPVAGSRFGLLQLNGAHGTLGVAGSTWFDDVVVRTFVWTPDNDGAGSGLDADTLDGQEGSYYADPANLTFRGALVYRDSAQSIPHVTNTKIQFDKETYDTDGFHDNVTNNTRLTIPSGLGITKVVLSAFVLFGAHATGRRELSFFKNGGVAGPGSRDVRNTDPNNEGTTVAMTSAPLTVADGDYLEVNVWQNSGGALSAAGATEDLWFSLMVVG